MSDYIKREDALEQFDYYDLGEYLTTQIRDMLMDIPSADVAPVRHGKWIEGKLSMCRWDGIEIGEKSTWTCSECHDVGFWAYNYCPNCGAKMDEGE